MAISFLPLLANPDSFLLPSLAFLFFHQVLVGHIKHRVDILASGRDRVKSPAFWLYRGFQKCNLVSFEKLKHVTWHFSFHLMELSMLGRSVHFERLAISTVILGLAG